MLNSAFSLVAASATPCPALERVPPLGGDENKYGLGEGLSGNIRLGLDGGKKRLPVTAGGRYAFLAGGNPPAGFSSLNIRADNRKPSVMRYFYVRSKPSCAHIMVGRGGGALRLAGFVYASLLTLLRLTTPFSSGLVRLSNLIHEAAAMVATPTPLHPKFTFHFLAVRRSDLNDKPHRESVTGQGLSGNSRLGLDDGKKRLPVTAGGRYAFLASPQWAAGRRNPCKHMATPDAYSVFFYVATSTHLYSTAYCRPVSMVALAGQLSSWPVSLCAGIPTPVNVTTPLECRNSGGGSLIKHKEIATMATTPTQTHPKFTWRFLALPRADRSAKPCRLSIETTSEREARQALAPFFILSFAGRLPVHTVQGENNSNLRFETVRGYALPAPAKSGVGICTPVEFRAHNRAKAVFLCATHSYIQSMVGRAGEPQGSPVSLIPGSANPARLTTLEICTSGGELSKTESEAATMATIPTPLHPSFLAISAMEVRHA